MNVCSYMKACSYMNISYYDTRFIHMKCREFFSSHASDTVIRKKSTMSL